MKTFWVSLAIGMLFLLGGCMESQYEKLNADSDQDELVKRKELDTGSLLTIPNHHGFYVNSFYTSDPLNTILGNDTNETELLEWATLHEFNSISLYSIRNVLLTGDADLIDRLGEFVSRAKNDYGLEVVFSAGGLDGITRIRSYCEDNANNPDALPTGIVTEYEFWNEGDNSTANSFEVYLQMLHILEGMIETYDFVRSYLYISRFEDFAYDGNPFSSGDDTGPGSGDDDPVNYCPSDVMEIILRKIKEVGEDKLYISLVNYREEAYDFPTTINGFYTRLQRLATMASAEFPSDYDGAEYICEYFERLDMYVNIVFIFNVNTASGDYDIYHYFDHLQQDHEFESAINNFEIGFNNSAITNKDRLQIQGSQIYRYSNAKAARPD